MAFYHIIIEIRVWNHILIKLLVDIFFPFILVVIAKDFIFRTGRKTFLVRFCAKYFT